MRSRIWTHRGSTIGLLTAAMIVLWSGNAAGLGITSTGEIITGTVAQPGNLETIREAIATAGADWKADENWVTGLSFEEQRLLLGGRLPAGAAKLAIMNALSEPRAQASKRDLPAEFNWQNVDGQDWMTTVKNQGNCGSCAAFASTGCLEAVIRIVRNDSDLAIDLSEQQIFSCAGGDCPTGLYMGDAFDYVKNNGLADEACLPYKQVDDNCDDLCDDWQDRVENIDDWELLWQYNVDEDALKSVVMDHPVACYLEVYGDFMSYSSGVYEHVTGGLQGGHFVVIVGWNDADDCWICKNSWGAAWGEKGYFRIKRGETQIGTWAMIPFYTPPGPTPTPTPVPELGVTLDLSQTHFEAGDTFYLDATITNPGTIMVNVPLFVFLDLAGQYWFWPSWSELPAIDYTTRNITAGVTTIEIIAPFEWPDVDVSGITLNFWAAMLKTDFSDILGTIDKVEWGF